VADFVGLDYSTSSLIPKHTADAKNTKNEGANTFVCSAKRAADTKMIQK
jgi:hypothetical protein